ncbi:MAG TPA: YraN family protein [Bacteroidetes bacterium]|nr:YraN family protein [Bacteroidota bacterium]
MSHNLTIGKKGEEIAVEFLVEKGYLILERNWRFKKAEIDIIAKDKDGTLVFVEVKTRSYTYFGEPEAFVNDKKKSLMLDTASEYMRTIDYDWAIRFDIIGIVIEKEGSPKVSHFEDAFFD